MIFFRLIYSMPGLVLFLALSACGTTGGSALPQSSLPPPNECDDDCITVSSPNTEGQVVVTGSAGAVPNSALVLVKIESGSTSFLKPFHMLDSLIPSALAQGLCSSDVPECLEIEPGFEGICQLIAEADGSFRATLYASEEQSLKISYLDPESCEEVTRVENRISELVVANLIPLPLRGFHLAMVDDQLFVFGTKGERMALLWTDPDGLEVDPPSFTLAEQLELIGGPAGLTSLDGISDGDGTSKDLLFLFTTQEARGIDINLFMQDWGDSRALLNFQETSPILSTNFRVNQVIAQKGFRYPDLGDDNLVNDCPDEAALEPYWSNQIDRLFFSRTVNPDDPIERMHPITVVDGVLSWEATGTISVRPINFSAIFSGALPENALLTSVVDMIQVGDRAFFMGDFTIGETNRYYLIEIPMEFVFCDGMAPYDDNLLVLPLPEDLHIPGRLSSFMGSSVIGTSERFIVLPNQSEAQVYIIDIESGELENLDVEILQDDASIFDGVSLLLPGELPGDRVGFIGIGEFARLNQFSLAEGSGEFDFAMTELTSNLIAGINPVDMIINSDQSPDAISRTLDQIIVLNQEWPVGDVSSLRVILREELLAQ